MRHLDAGVLTALVCAIRAALHAMQSGVRMRNSPKRERAELWSIAENLLVLIPASARVSAFRFPTAG